MTLAIYLDSNDYSRFAELDKQTGSIRAAFDALLTWVREGRIVIRYSSVNVLEAAPLTKGAVTQAQQRLDVIYRLCGTKCLIDVMRMLKAEATQATSVQVFSDIGDWHPVVYDLAIPDAPTIARAILAGARGAATSKRMKRFERQFFNSSGRLRASARPRIVEFRKSIGAVPFTQYPLSPRALDTYYAFLLGRVKRRQLTAALVESFSDLNRWGKWYDEAWDAADSLTRQLRKPAEKLADDIRRLAAMLEVLFKELKHRGLGAKEIQRRVGEKANPHAMRNQLLALVSIEAPTLPPRVEFSWNATPAFETYSKVAMQVVRDSAMLVTMPRRTLDSDFVDCLHVCYLPFVDVFRADAYMANVIERCKLPIKTQVVAKLEDLPEVIASHSRFNC